MANSNAMLKKQRVMNFFLDAAKEIARESGIKSITIRGVAERAGYNMTTIYNYFESIDQLVAFAVIRRTSKYIYDLVRRIPELRSPMEDYITLWKCYCEHSFADPTFFMYAFNSDEATMNKVQSYTDSYFDIFPQSIEGDYNEALLKAYMANSCTERFRSVAGIFAEAGNWTMENMTRVDSFAVILNTGLLHQAITLKDKTPNEYTDIFLSYFIPFLRETLSETQK